MPRRRSQRSRRLQTWRSGPDLDLIRPPCGPLKPFIEVLWAKDPQAQAAQRECVLPTGSMHLALRLDPEPVKLFRHLDDPAGQRVGHAVVGGARSTAFIKDVAAPARSVGAMLHPGAARALFGVDADALAERHVPLAAFWGREAATLRQRLARAEDNEAALALFEAALLERMPRLRGAHPAVVAALERFAEGSGVAAVQTASGYSQRGFIALFRRHVGLAPKRYCRVLRLQHLLSAWREAPGCTLADLALAAGYSDQPHLQREFLELTGLTPGRFRELSPVRSHHVPLRSDSFKPAAPEGE